MHAAGRVRDCVGDGGGANHDETDRAAAVTRSAAAAFMLTLGMLGGEGEGGGDGSARSRSSSSGRSSASTGSRRRARRGTEDGEAATLAHVQRRGRVAAEAEARRAQKRRADRPVAAADQTVVGPRGRHATGPGVRQRVVEPEEPAGGGSQDTVVGLPLPSADVSGDAGDVSAAPSVRAGASVGR